MNSEEELAERKRLAALAESVLHFRWLAAQALDKLICNLILDNDACGGYEFSDSKGRRCQVMLVMGDEAVEYVQKKWHMPREVAGDEKDLNTK